MGGCEQINLALKPSEIQDANVRTKVRTVCGECRLLYPISNLWIEAFAAARACANASFSALLAVRARVLLSQGAVLPLVS